MATVGGIKVGRAAFHMPIDCQHRLQILAAVMPQFGDHLHITEDYDMTRGGFLGIGLLFMAATPMLAARLRSKPITG